MDLKHVFARVWVQGVSQRPPVRARRLPIVSSINLQLQLAVIAHSKKVEITFSQTNKSQRRSKITALWKPVCDGRLPLGPIPVLIIVLCIVSVKLAYDVDAVWRLVDDLGRSLEYATRILPISPVRNVPELQIRIFPHCPQVNSMLSPDETTVVPINGPLSPVRSSQPTHWSPLQYFCFNAPSGVIPKMSSRLLPHDTTTGGLLSCYQNSPRRFLEAASSDPHYLNGPGYELKACPFTG